MTKVKINVLLAGPLPVVVRLAPVALRKMLVRALVPLGIRLLIILLIITLRWRGRLPLLPLVVKLFFYSFLLLIE